MKGARAAASGYGESVCPYRKKAGQTWLSAYRSAWLRGYQSIPRR